ncbi:hypothetical protein SETIT_5G161000v2 [Setaria italica]|uniref:Uncharacterized protein n=1 Tax=Setaria italica TaxID=4555 RepID=A0A368R719_SETIT|nr:hypothetical protein SETIT_5G161000v2 [Setaria italica]
MIADQEFHHTLTLGSFEFAPTVSLVSFVLCAENKAAWDSPRVAKGIISSRQSERDTSSVRVRCKPQRIESPGSGRTAGGPSKVPLQEGVTSWMSRGGIHTQSLKGTWRMA